MLGSEFNISRGKISLLKAKPIFNAPLRDLNEEHSQVASLYRLEIEGKLKLFKVPGVCTGEFNFAFKSSLFAKKC